MPDIFKCIYIYNNRIYVFVYPLKIKKTYYNVYKRLTNILLVKLSSK